MIKKINLLLLLLCSMVTMAQQSTSSPYSFYGIGDIKFKGTAENRLMGSISMFPDSTHVNIQNPAAYPSLNLTTYTVGGSFNSSRLNSFYGNEKAQRTTLDYMAVGIPMKKMGLGFGLIPYSAVGYRIRNTDPDGTIHRYNATGGLNKVFVGFGYKINNNLSLGADLQYNFGRIETVGIEKIPEVQLGSQEVNTSDLSGVNFDLSLMYKRKINSKIDGYASLILSPQSNLTSKNTRVVSTVLYSDVFDPQNYDVFDPIYSKNTIKLPAKATIGFGAGHAKKWMLGTEFTFQQTSKFGNRYNDIQNVEYKNAFRYSLGGYYIPNYASFSNYLKKITYRGGFRYEDTGMKINNETIRDYAFSAGMGLPLGGAFSNLNLGVEYGRRGTAKALLIEENYTNVILSVSLNDRWFIKRKYD
ncbi:hypothetical protein G4D82_01285 [Flavobacterium sp. CYK-4]|uniref:hypothetical protein n=1 Tax=Flavobacterium lotistagni TaxID=2709660 RepID=UPI001407AB0B|nr:hypothetical protein [Flavobacterium lotistagni]NHM05842.1 hypothetical protein [Flavobacterium lotistagni]